MATTKNHTYNQLLATVFLAGPICQRAVFFEDKAHDNNVQRSLKKAITNGHIKIYKYPERYGTHLRDYSYLAITAAGLRYLATWGDLPWEKSLPSNVKRVSIFDGSASSSAAYMVRCGNTLNFAINAGADLTGFVLTGVPSPLPARSLTMPAPTLTGDDVMEDETAMEERGDPPCEAQETEAADAPSTTLSAIRRETAAHLKAAGFSPSLSQNNGLIFYLAKEVRAMLKQYDALAGKTTAFNHARFTGILTSPLGTYIMYHAKHGGLPWIENFETNDTRVARKFDIVCAPKSTLPPGEAYGIVLVYNAKNFGDVIKNKFDLRKQGTQIGRQFSRFYFAPLSKLGAHFVTLLVTEKLQDRQAFINSRANALYKITPNRGRYIGGFRLRQGDTYIFDGTDMDAKQIFSAIDDITAAASTPNPIQFKVLCFYWQEPFYRKLWPDVEYLWVVQ